MSSSSSTSSSSSSSSLRRTPASGHNHVEQAAHFASLGLPSDFALTAYTKLKG
jgi:hypothetical protein